MRNNLITILAILLTKGIFGLILIFLLIVIFVSIHWHFEPTAYQQVDISSGFEAGYGIKGIKIQPSEVSSKALVLSELGHAMFYWLLFRSLLFFAITGLIVLRILKVLHSIRSLHTFYDDNIRHFKRLGLLGFVSFVLSCFNFLYLDGELKISFTIAFAPLLFSIACYVMAEIFTEGKLLQEDKDQII